MYFYSLPSGTDPNRGQRGPGPPLGPKIFFFLVCKIFKKRLGPPWFFSSGPSHLNQYPYPSRPAQEFSRAHENLKIYICKKEKRKKKQSVRPQNQTEKPETKEKKKKKRKKKERERWEWDRERREPSHRDAAVHAHTRETHLANQYPRRHQLSHTQTRDPSCRRRQLLDLHYPKFTGI